MVAACWGLDVERTKFEDLERLITDEYRLSKRKSIAELASSFRALKKYFAGWKARDITYAALASYAARRVGAPSTIKREFAQLHHAFKLAERAQIAECPSFPTIEVNNARRGFFEKGDWHSLRKHLSSHYQDVGDFAEQTGWRLWKFCDWNGAR